MSKLDAHNQQLAAAYDYLRASSNRLLTQAIADMKKLLEPGPNGNLRYSAIQQAASRLATLAAKCDAIDAIDSEAAALAEKG